MLEPSVSAPDRTRDAELVRSFMLTYVVDRLGRDAPIESRAIAWDALDRLERGDA